MKSHLEKALSAVHNHICYNSINYHKQQTKQTSNMQNQQGQGISHAAGDSVVPQKVQEQAPIGLEKNLPNKVYHT